MSGEGTDYDTLCGMEKVKKVVLSYAGSTPDATQSLPDYELSLYVLPFEREYFNLADKVRYGSYFTEEAQVLLSFEEAEKLSPGNHGALIGSTISKNIYSLGRMNFEIVGVLDRLNEFEKKYLLSLGMDTDSIYFNSRLTDRFIDPEDYYMQSQRDYYLFFDSFRDLSAFYKEYAGQFDEKGESLLISSRLYSGRVTSAVTTLSILLIPLSVFIALFTVVFYATLLKTEITYNNRFIAVFEYSGYSKRRVLASFTAIHMLRLILSLLISLAIALLFTETVNMINRKLVLIEFRPFTLNYLLMAAFLLFVVLLSWLCIAVSLRRVRISSWYDNLKLRLAI